MLLREAELQRINAETSKILAEKAKFELEEQELKQKLQKPWYRSKRFYQAIAASVIMIPLFTFYLKEFAIPIYQAKNEKLYLETIRKEQALFEEKQRHQKKESALRKEARQIDEARLSLEKKYNKFRDTTNRQIMLYTKQSDQAEEKAKTFDAELKHERAQRKIDQNKIAFLEAKYLESIEEVKNFKKKLEEAKNARNKISESRETLSKSAFTSENRNSVSSYISDLDNIESIALDLME